MHVGIADAGSFRDPGSRILSHDGRIVRDMTPLPTEPGLTDEQRWKKAGMTPGDVTLVNAHATSTPAGDVEEMKANPSLYTQYLAEKSATVKPN